MDCDQIGAFVIRHDIPPKMAANRGGHTNYAHVMEVYNGFTNSYNLDGISSQNEFAKRMLYVEPLTEQILMCAAFVAGKFN